MDISMPHTNGLEATRQIRESFPAARVLILSSRTDDAFVESAARSHASGYLVKQSSADVLAKAIRTVQEGGTFVSPAVAKRFGKLRQASTGRASEHVSHS